MVRWHRSRSLNRWAIRATVALALQILFLILLFALGRAGDFMLVAVLATTAFTVLFIAALFCFNSARP